MSVLIKGMKMPESCGKCDFNVSSLYCKRTRSEIDRDYEYRERLSDCTISALLDKHGRLIYADKLKDKMRGKWTVYDYEALGTMPTIVEAEGEA